VTDGHSINIEIKSQTSEYSANITAVISLNMKERQPSFNVDIGNWNTPKNIQVADPRFYAPQRVDLLIKASLFFEMLCVGQIKLLPGLIQKTRLGWVVSGGYGLSNGSSLISSQDVRLASRENSFDRLDDLLQRFWKVESCVEPILRATFPKAHRSFASWRLFCSAACQAQTRSLGRVLPASLSKILQLVIIYIKYPII